MTTIPTQDLTGAALDYAVTRLENRDAYGITEEALLDLACRCLSHDGDGPHAVFCGPPSEVDRFAQALKKAMAAGKPLNVLPYSTDWSCGGPIIEREQITLDLTDVLFDHVTDTAVHLDTPEWWASRGDATGRGPTSLIAAMRCYVASRLGDTVEIPATLV